MFPRMAVLVALSLVTIAAEAHSAELEDAIAVVRQFQSIESELCTKDGSAKIEELTTHYADQAILITDDGPLVGTKSIQKSLADHLKIIQKGLADGVTFDFKHTDHTAKKLKTGSIVVTTLDTHYITVKDATKRFLYTSAYVLILDGEQWKIAFEVAHERK